LNDLTIDESRKASDWDVKHHCGKALANADKSILAMLFDRLLNSDKPVWEFGFDTYSLQPTYRDNPENEQRKRQNWQEAFAQVAGDDAVLTGEGTADQLERKGYKPVKAPENLIRAAEQYGVQTPGKVLSSDEMAGRNITDPTPDAQVAVDLVWSLLEEVGLTLGKVKPPVRCFISILDGGVMLNGFYRDGTVFINSNLAGSSSGVAGPQALSDQLVKVALEEVVHYVTGGATDNSRDFQDFLLNLAVKLSKRKN
jgi:hypothetical protein